MNAGVSHSRKLMVSQAGCAGALSCWKIKNSEISRMTGSSCSVSSTSWQAVCAINVNPKWTNIRFVFPNLDAPTNTISNLLKVERIRRRSFIRWCSDICLTYGEKHTRNKGFAAKESQFAESNTERIFFNRSTFAKVMPKTRVA